MPASPCSTFVKCRFVLVRRSQRDDSQSCDLGNLVYEWSVGRTKGSDGIVIHMPCAYREQDANQFSTESDKRLFRLKRVIHTSLEMLVQQLEL